MYPSRSAATGNGRLNGQLGQPRNTRKVTGGSDVQVKVQQQELPQPPQPPQPPQEQTATTTEGSVTVVVRCVPDVVERGETCVQPQ